MACGVAYRVRGNERTRERPCLADERLNLGVMAVLISGLIQELNFGLIEALTLGLIEGLNWGLIEALYFTRARGLGIGILSAGPASLRNAVKERKSMAQSDRDTLSLAALSCSCRER